MAKDIFIGNPTIFQKWYDKVRPLTIDEYLEKIEFDPIFDRIIKIDTTLYQGDDGKLIKPIEWEILGYNGVIPEYVRYGTYFVKLFETNIENGEELDFDNPIKAGQKVYERTWNTETLQWDYIEAFTNTKVSPAKSTTILNINHNENDYVYGATNEDNKQYGITTNPNCEKTLTIPGNIGVKIKYKSYESATSLDLNLIFTVQIQTKNLFMDLDWCKNYDDAKAKLKDPNYFSTIVYDLDNLSSDENSYHPWPTATIRSWLNGLSSNVIGSHTNIEELNTVDWNDEAQVSAYQLNNSYLTKHSFLNKFDEGFLQLLSPSINQTYSIADNKVLYSFDKVWLPSIGDYTTAMYNTLKAEGMTEESWNQYKSQFTPDVMSTINLFNKLNNIDIDFLKIYKKYETGCDYHNMMGLRSDGPTDQEGYLRMGFELFEDNDIKRQTLELYEKSWLYIGFAPICSLEVHFN